MSSPVVSWLTLDSDEALEIFKELFLQACPKYLNVNPPPYEDEAALADWKEHPPQDASQRHLELFLSDIGAVKGVPSVRNLLKLYTSIDASKLSAFMRSADEDGEEEILQQLMVLKAASRTYAKGQGHRSLLDGDRIVTNNLDFTIDAVSPYERLRGSADQFSRWYMSRKLRRIGDTLAFSSGELSSCAQAIRKMTVSQKRRARSTCLPLYPLRSTSNSATITGSTGNSITGQWSVIRWG